MVEIDGEKFFSTQEVAEKLGITSSRVSQLRKSGLMNYHQITAKKFLYSEKHVLDYIKGTNNPDQDVELSAQTKEEVIEQLLQMISGKEDNFDKLIKNIEVRSYEKWKSDFISRNPGKHDENKLVERYARMYKFSSWIKDSKSKEGQILELLKDIMQQQNDLGSS